MNTTITVKPYIDELMKEYNQLSMQNEINPPEYAKKWEQLAEKALAQDRPWMWEHAKAHAEHYGQYDPGEYLKLVDGPLAELVFVSPLLTVTETEQADAS